MAMTYTTLGALRRADQVYYEQISERRTLEYGLAFYAPDYPDAPGDNAFREVLVPAADALQPAWDEAEAFFAGERLRCLRWVPSADQDVDLLDGFLVERGFVRRTRLALSLAEWPEPGPAPADVRVLPARAMRRAFRGLQVGDDSVELAERRLDYAQYDMYLAVESGRAVGRCGLFQVGEIADVRDLYVIPQRRRAGIATALLGEVLGLARRLMMRNVVAKFGSELAAAAVPFLECRGFVRDGELVEFDRRA